MQPGVKGLHLGAARRGFPAAGLAGEGTLRKPGPCAHNRQSSWCGETGAIAASPHARLLPGVPLLLWETEETVLLP